MSRIRNRINDGSPAVGAWLTTSSPMVADAMMSLGFDWLAIEMEHALISADAVVGASLAAERNGADLLVRLPSDDALLARRTLDLGGKGVLVPRVESAASFEAFIDACTYPPAGRRGVALMRANGWGERFEDDLSHFRPLLIPIVESAAGVAEIAAIAALPAVEVVFVGPWDLSADLGVPGDFAAPAFTEAMAAITAAVRDNGKVLGTHLAEPDAAKLRELIAEGYGFIAYSTDLIALRHALDGIREIAGGADK